MPTWGGCYWAKKTNVFLSPFCGGGGGISCCPLVQSLHGRRRDKMMKYRLRISDALHGTHPSTWYRHSDGETDSPSRGHGSNPSRVDRSFSWLLAYGSWKLMPGLHTVGGRETILSRRDTCDGLYLRRTKLNALWVCLLSGSYINSRNEKESSGQFE